MEHIEMKTGVGQSGKPLFRTIDGNVLEKSHLLETAGDWNADGARSQ